MNPPYNYDYRNTANSLITPSTVHVAGTASAQFIKRGLLQRVISRYKIKLPDTWAKNYFNYVLFGLGYISVVKTDKFGIIPQHASLAGYSVQYQPTRAIVSNPLFNKQYDLKIGTECSVIKMQPDFGGILDVVDYYGNLIALASQALEFNLINSKLAFVFAAQDKGAAETFKKLYDKVSEGNPAVVAGSKVFNEDGELLVQFFSQDLGQNFIAGSILDTIRTLYNMFDTEVGIMNANLAKKERMNETELTLNDGETKSRLYVWLETMQEGFKQTREMFGYTEAELSIELREEEVEDERNDEYSRNL